MWLISRTSPSDINMCASLGWATSIGFRQHDKWHYKLRRALISAMHPAAARSYATQHLDATLDMLRRISKTPAAFEKHTNDVVGESILQMTYGYKAVENDPLLATVR